MDATDEKTPTERPRTARHWFVACLPLRRIADARERAHSIGTKTVTIEASTYEITLEQVEPYNQALTRHELKHDEQRAKFRERGGKFLGEAVFWLTYAYNHFRYGHRYNPFEIEARAAEGEGGVFTVD